jgi:hypothetical protein
MKCMASDDVDMQHVMIGKTRNQNPICPSFVYEMNILYPSIFYLHLQNDHEDILDVKFPESNGRMLLSRHNLHFTIYLTKCL